MKIYASGDGISLDRKKSEYVTMGRVVGMMDLGGNNGDNSYGWCGLKAVVVSDETLFILDFPEASAMRSEPDDILSAEENDEGHPWCPVPGDFHKYKLFNFPHDGID